MKHLAYFGFLTLTSLLFSCSILPQRMPQSTSGVVVDVAEPTMVVLVSNTRMPASGPTMDLSKPTDDVVVSAQTMKLPGDTMQHGSLVFSVKNHPDLSAQITGHSEGGEVSKKFTTLVSGYVKTGVTPYAAKVIADTQKKIAALVHLPADQREDALKVVLFETRDKLVAAN